MSVSPVEGKREERRERHVRRVGRQTGKSPEQRHIRFARGMLCRRCAKLQDREAVRTPKEESKPRAWATLRTAGERSCCREFRCAEGHHSEPC